ncbi:MAG: peptidase S41 [Dehalococcoidia bacterium]|nr:MAG: peptidase S41 [Dehalococcoidia bacterium]
MQRLIRLSAVAVFIASLVIVSFGVGVGVGRYSPAVVAGLPPAIVIGPASAADGFGLLNEVLRILREDYVDRASLNTPHLVEGAVRGLVEAAGDPNQSYLTPEQFREAMRNTQGIAFDGIGATVNMDENNRLLIVSPIAGSPAAAAGLRPGDWIMAANGEDTTKMTVAEAVQKIRGPRGTVVRLTIKRGEEKPFDVEIVRGPIPEITVSYRLLPEGVVHLQITQVTQRTGEELRNAIPEILQARPRGIILDLRYNPGGSLNATIEVASQFLKDGIVLEDVNASGVRHTYQVQPGGQLTDLPLVVLVNKGSASAAEVLAGAFQDHRRATIVGESTFGKGTVNTWKELSNGGAVYVSISHWYTPNGRRIERQGITPDIVVPMSEEDWRAGNDRQLRRAIDVLLGSSR